MSKLPFDDVFKISFQGVFQEAPSYTMLQHDAVHVQYVNDAQRESEHAFLFPHAARHVWIRRETSHAGSIPRLHFNLTNNLELITSHSGNDILKIFTKLVISMCIL